MKRLSVLGGSAALIMVFAACSGGESPEATEPTPTPEVSVEVEAQDGEVTESEPIDVGRQPAVGECWNQVEISGLTQEGEPADCSLEHTQRTLAVLDLPEDYPSPFERERATERAGAIEDRESDAYVEARLEVLSFRLGFADSTGPYSQCSAIVNEEIGAADTWQDTFPWGVDVTFPDETQWEQGQRWARCNITKRTSLRSKKLAVLPTPLPTQTPISMKTGTCALKERRVACSKLTEKQTEDGRWYRALTGMPKPASSPLATNTAEANDLAAQACIRSLQGKVDSSALDVEYIKTTLSSTAATIEWLKQGQPKDPTAAYWNADDVTIQCEIPTWAVRK